MTNPGAYEQYPRPSAPAGPSSWQQPGFAETSEPPTPGAFFVVHERPPSGLAALRRDLVPSRKSSRRSLRIWSRVTLAAAVLAGVLVLAGVTTQVAYFFGLAVAAAMGAVVGLLQTLTAVIQLWSRPAGSREDNG